MVDDILKMFGVVGFDLKTDASLLTLAFREWQKSRVYEIADMRRIAWKAVLEEMVSVPGKDEDLDRAPEGMNAPGKAA